MRDASSVRCQDPHPNPPRNPLFQCTPSEFWEIGQTGRYSPVSETDHLKRKIILFSKTKSPMDALYFAYSGFYHKWISSCREFFISCWSGIQSEAVLFSHIRGWGGSLQGILSALPFPLPLFSIQIGLKGAKLADQPSHSACTDLFNTSDGTDLKLLWMWRSIID